MTDCKLHIAITGESGSGKSSFVNSLRGLMDDDVDSAQTGVIEMTACPTPYQFLKNPDVLLWDLPGIGTPLFQPKSYFQQVKFHQYDVYIIIASERFKSNHAMLARGIENMGKRFYFVRTKVDLDLHASKRKLKSVYNETQILQTIRQNTIDCLSAEGLDASQVFLISNFELDRYDFPALLKALENDIPAHILDASKSQWNRGCLLQ